METVESKQFIVLQELQGNQLASLHPVQKALLPYLGLFTGVWGVVWFSVLFILTLYVAKRFISSFANRESVDD